MKRILTISLTLIFFSLIVYVSKLYMSHSFVADTIIEVTTARIDIGRINDENPHAQFEIVNIGKNDLEIDKIETSCSCISARLNKTVIIPKDEALITLIYNDVNTKGYFMETVEVFGNFKEESILLIFQGFIE